MTDLLSNLELGFAVALSWQNLALCFIGCLLGTLVGVLPGIGPLPTMAMLLPITFKLDPTGALIMLAGVFYGAQYGGSTTAILLRLPGETSSLVTILDGYALAKKGRAGTALAMAAYGSVVAGLLTTIVIGIAAPLLASVALLFQSADYVSVIILGLVGAVVLAQGSVLKALAVITFGALLGLVGTDVSSGEFRMTMGFHSIADGLGFVPIAMGLFGLAEIAQNLETTQGKGERIRTIGRLLPSFSELVTTLPSILRGTLIGTAFGILPGGGPTISAFSAYSLEKKISRQPERFGSGALEGVAAPEAANNAAAQACFIPMLSLGIPPNAIMALMIGAMMIHKANTLRILAISGEERDPKVPDVPTFKELGYDITAGTMRAIVAPKRLAPERRAKLEQALLTAMNDPKLRERASALSFGISPVGSSEATNMVKQLDAQLYPVLAEADMVKFRKK